MPAWRCHQRFLPRTSGVPGARRRRSRSQLQEAKSPKECQNPGSTGQVLQSLSAPPQPFMGLFTSIKAVIKVTGQDGGYCCAPITRHVSSIFPCQLPNKLWFSSLRPAALASFHFLCISTQGDLSPQRGSVSARFIDERYWWLPRRWIWSYQQRKGVSFKVQSCWFSMNCHLVATQLLVLFPP